MSIKFTGLQVKSFDLNNFLLFNKNAIIGSYIYFEGEKMTKPI